LLLLLLLHRCCCRYVTTLYCCVVIVRFIVCDYCTLLLHCWRCYVTLLLPCCCCCVGLCCCCCCYILLLLIVVTFTCCLLLATFVVVVVVFDLHLRLLLRCVVVVVALLLRYTICPVIVVRYYCFVVVLVVICCCCCCCYVVGYIYIILLLLLFILPLPRRYLVTHCCCCYTLLLLLFIVLFVIYTRLLLCYLARCCYLLLFPFACCCWLWFSLGYVCLLLCPLRVYSRWYVAYIYCYFVVTVVVTHCCWFTALLYVPVRYCCCRCRLLNLPLRCDAFVVATLLFCCTVPTRYGLLLLPVACASSATRLLPRLLLFVGLHCFICLVVVVIVERCVALLRLFTDYCYVVATLLRYVVYLFYCCCPLIYLVPLYYVVVLFCVCYSFVVVERYVARCWTFVVYVVVLVVVVTHVFVRCCWLLLLRLPDLLLFVVVDYVADLLPILRCCPLLLYVTLPPCLLTFLLAHCSCTVFTFFAFDPLPRLPTLRIPVTVVALICGWTLYGTLLQRCCCLLITLWRCYWRSVCVCLRYVCVCYPTVCWLPHVHLHAHCRCGTAYHALRFGCMWFLLCSLLLVGCLPTLRYCSLILTATRTVYVHVTYIYVVLICVDSPTIADPYDLHRPLTTFIPALRPYLRLRVLPRSCSVVCVRTFTVATRALVWLWLVVVVICYYLFIGCALLFLFPVICCYCDFVLCYVVDCAHCMLFCCCTHLVVTLFVVLLNFVVVTDSCFICCWLLLRCCCIAIDTRCCWFDFTLACHVQCYCCTVLLVVGVPQYWLVLCSARCPLLLPFTLPWLHSYLRLLHTFVTCTFVVYLPIYDCPLLVCYTDCVLLRLFPIVLLLFAYLHTLPAARYSLPVLPLPLVVVLDCFVIAFCCGVDYRLTFVAVDLLPLRFAVVTRCYTLLLRWICYCTSSRWYVDCSPVWLLLLLLPLLVLLRLRCRFDCRGWPSLAVVALLPVVVCSLLRDLSTCHCHLLPLPVGVVAGSYVHLRLPWWLLPFFPLPLCSPFVTMIAIYIVIPGCSRFRLQLRVVVPGCCYAVTCRFYVTLRIVDPFVGWSFHCCCRCYCRCCRFWLHFVVLVAGYVLPTLGATFADLLPVTLPTRVVCGTITPRAFTTHLPLIIPLLDLPFVVVVALLLLDCVVTVLLVDVCCPVTRLRRCCYVVVRALRCCCSGRWLLFLLLLRYAYIYPVARLRCCLFVTPFGWVRCDPLQFYIVATRCSYWFNALLLHWLRFCTVAVLCCSTAVYRLFFTTLLHITYWQRCYRTFTLFCGC